jgi:hypothetical protein
VKSIVIFFNDYPNNYHTSPIKYILLSTAVQDLSYALSNHLNIYTAVCILLVIARVLVRLKRARKATIF